MGVDEEAGGFAEGESVVELEGGGVGGDEGKGGGDVEEGVDEGDVILREV